RSVASSRAPTWSARISRAGTSAIPTDGICKSVIRRRIVETRAFRGADTQVRPYNARLKGWRIHADAFQGWLVRSRVWRAARRAVVEAAAGAVSDAVGR